jgi:GTPase SAR1 family protein
MPIGTSEQSRFAAPDDLAIGGLPTGVRLIRTFPGTGGPIGPIAWSPQSPVLAFPSADHSIGLWDVETGRCLRQLKGHKDKVFALAFDGSGRRLATAGDDKTIRIWDPNTGENLHCLRGHTDTIWSVAFDPTGVVLASASDDRTVRLWNATSGKPVKVLAGHRHYVLNVAFDSTGHRLFSADLDARLLLWDIATGVAVGGLKLREGGSGFAVDPKSGTVALAAGETLSILDSDCRRMVRSLEGHTHSVRRIAFSDSGILIASRDNGETLYSENSVLSSVRLWRNDTGASLGTITLPLPEHWTAGLAFHPRAPLLAAVSNHDDGNDRVSVWQVDVDFLLSSSDTPPVAYTSAKIVVVGDSGVGKTGLGWRLAHGAFQEHPSTHGQQFWVINQLSKRRDHDGAQCEAVLWDLAGQPDYRLIHALFLDDADLALVLFDPTDSRDPLHGVEFWLKQLKGAGRRPGDQVSDSPERQLCPIILVAARADRGTARLTSEELDAFCQQRGICGHVSTSALQSEGIQQLVERVKSLVPWNLKSATITTDTFKRIKDHVLTRKQAGNGAQLIVDPHEMRKKLEATDPDLRFTDAEMLTAVGHLENHGYVKILRTSKGDARILLAPDILNNLAASIVLEARRNPKGLGSLEEKRLLAAEYPLRELDGLVPAERDVLLDAAALLFLNHNICFRETDPLNFQSYLVFPELINLQKPATEDDQPTRDGMAYGVTGAVENVYASLVVLLGYTHAFTRTNQWRNHARYEIGNGWLCAFRLEAERDGELDLVLYFGTSVALTIRTLFQSLFEAFLARRNLTVHRYEPVVCPTCQVVLERAVVKTKAREGKSFTFCSDCGERLTLPNINQPIQLTLEEQAAVDAQRLAADMRTRFEQAAFRMQTYRNERGQDPPRCFISYAWGEVEHERWVERNLATDLQKAGIDVVLDRWENAKIGASVPRFVERIVECDRVIVVGTPHYLRKYQNKGAIGSIVAAEGDLISNRLAGTEEQKQTVLPILLAGDVAASLPPLLHGRVHADFREQQTYFAVIFDVILSVYGIAPHVAAVAPLRASLSPDEPSPGPSRPLTRNR